jgi:4-hydroxy-tetrahydrodipicolinate reductase
VVLVGLGPIGIDIGDALALRDDMVVTGAADPAFAGQPLRKLVGKAPRKVIIDASLTDALAHGADVIALATSSRLKRVAADLDAAIAARVHVVSTCEELAAPSADPVKWGRLDARAKEQGVTVLGTGVNPGFVMDRLVLQLAGACISVERVRVERVVDAARRRGPLRQKIGEGLTVAEFKAGVAAGTIGHVGLRQSATLVTAGLGWKLGRYREKIDPVTGEDGRCVGLRQTASVDVDGRERVSLTLAMFVDAPSAMDRIVLEGDPPIDMKIIGGVHGDRGTIGTVVNAIGRVERAARGLVTVADVFV